MSTDGDEVGRIASAEKQLCERAGPLLGQIIREVEESHGVRIAELRITMDPSNPANGWSGANCVIVREDESLAHQGSKPLHWGAKVHEALAKR